MSKPLSEVPKETLERWKKLSTKPAPKKRKKPKIRVPRIPSVPITSKIPSLHLLRIETEKLKNAKSAEEIHAVQEKVRELQERVMEEGSEMREQAMQRAGTLRQQHMMRRMTTLLPGAQKIYECPKCHRTWAQSQLNYSGKGKHRKPWCPMCNLEIFSVGDKRLRHTIIPIKDKYPKNLTFVRRQE